MRRRILYADVAALTRAVLMVEDAMQEDLCLRLIREAQCAEAFRRETGRAHPIWGSGSLIEVARRRNMADERGFDDFVYCRAFRLVLNGLLAAGVSQKRS